MVIRWVYDVLLVAGTWLLVLACLAGLGLNAFRWFGLRLHALADLPFAFWLGWILWVVFLEGLHLALPVTPALLLVLALLGLPGWRLFPQSAVRLCSCFCRRRAAAASLAILAALALVLYLADRALAAPDHFDTGFYHLAAAHWIAAFPVVPGIGNILYTLGYHQSFYVWPALFDGSPFHHPASFASGPLILATLAGSILETRRRGSPLPLRIFHAVAGLGSLFLALSTDLVSARPDVAVFLLEIVAAGQFANLVARYRSAPADGGTRLAVLLLLIAFLPTVKLSALLFCLALAAAAGGYWAWTRPRIPPLQASAAAVVLAIAIGVWALRGALMTGYPLFPFSFLSLDVPWRVPREVVDHFRDHIRAVAYNRTATVEDLHTGSLQWSEWAEEFIPQLDFTANAIAFFLGLVLLAGRRGWDPLDFPARRLLLWIGLPLTLAACAWAIYAPKVQYLGATGFLLNACLYAGLLARRGGVRLSLAKVGAAILLLPLLAEFYHRGLFVGPGPDGGFRPMPEPRFFRYSSRSGDSFWVVESGISLWNGPLPATIFPKPNLRALGPTPAHGYASSAPNPWPHAAYPPADL